MPCNGISFATLPDEGGNPCVPPTSTPVVKFSVDAPVGAAKELVTSGAPITKFPWSSVLNTGAVGPVYCTVDAGRKSGKGGKGGRRKSASEVMFYTMAALTVT